MLTDWWNQTGIGLAISKFLISQQHKLVVTSRSSQPLEDLRATAPTQVEIAAGDITDVKIAAKAVKLAVDTYGRLDGLVLNHGALDEVKRISDSDVEGWKRVFDINFFSCINVVCIVSFYARFYLILDLIRKRGHAFRILTALIPDPASSPSTSSNQWSNYIHFFRSSSRRILDVGTIRCFQSGHEPSYSHSQCRGT